MTTFLTTKYPLDMKRCEFILFYAFKNVREKNHWPGRRKMTLDVVGWSSNYHFYRAINHDFFRRLQLFAGLCIAILRPVIMWKLWSARSRSVYPFCRGRVRHGGFFSWGFYHFLFHICAPVCISICLFVYLYLSLCLSIYLSTVHLSICLHLHILHARSHTHTRTHVRTHTAHILE